MRLFRHSAAIAALLLLGSLAGLEASSPPVPFALRSTAGGGFRIAAHDESPPLRDLLPVAAELPRAEAEAGAAGLAGSRPMATAPAPHLPPVFTMPLVNFDALSNLAAVSPPEPSGDVGPNHYVLMTNYYFAVYSKSGSLLYGPAMNKVLWAGLGGSCETENDGQPRVLYDQRADRWLLSQTVIETGPGNYVCMAVSTTGDPAGSYHRWAMEFENRFPDAPLFAATRDSYLLTTREFLDGSTYLGVGIYAARRSDFLAGVAEPAAVSFALSGGITPQLGDGLVPVDLDGMAPLPAGTPDFLLGLMDNGGPYGATQDALAVWTLWIDYAGGPSAILSHAGTLPVAGFDSQFPCAPTPHDCIPQPGTTKKLDFVSYRQRLMPRAALRYVGATWRIAASHAVRESGSVAGIRWYELRSSGTGGLSVFQQGTYAPGTVDGVHRWNPSVATDRLGGLAVGFSASDGTSTYPSVRYAGRLAGDTLGALPQGEGSLMVGTGSQTSYGSRWGWFSSTTIDPDDCTFWHANEYIPTTSINGWRIRVGSFRFPACTPVVFADGFECASPGAWSSATP